MNVMHAPDIPDSVEWLNVTGPIEMDDLCGDYDLVLIGFWNQVDRPSWSLLEDLVSFSQECKDEICALAVHRPILSNTGSLRMNRFPEWIADRIVLGEDRNRELSRAYHVEATPALAIVNSEGNIVALLSGKMNRDRVFRAIERVLEQMDQTSKPSRRVLQRKLSGDQTSPYSIAVDGVSGQVAFTDPLSNRVVILTSDGKQLYEIGGETPGNETGNFEAARFRIPGGLLFHEGTLMVCDSANHTLKGIDRDTETVFTIAKSTSDRSFQWPMDLTVFDDQFWVTLAGSDQIARIERFEDSEVTFVGSGARGTDDGGPNEMTMAHPAGITHGDEKIYFVDTLSGSLRCYHPREQWGETLIQTGLFQGGNQVGAGEEAQLNSPVDLYYRDPFLYLVDQYNQQIKRYDPEVDEVETWLEREDFQTKDQSGFQSPAGITGRTDQLWLSDPASGRILGVDAEKWESSVFWEA